MADFEQFKDFMLQSAARHDVEIATIRESLSTVHGSLLTIRDSLKSMEGTIGVLVENQIHLQESMDEQHKATEEALRAARQDTRAELAELSRIVFGHLTDRDAHNRA